MPETPTESSSEPDRLKDRAMDQDDKGQRINRFLADHGIGSRREVDKFIQQGRVKFNNRMANLGDRVFPGDVVYVDGKPIEEQPKRIYLIYHKPVGVICTTDTRKKDNVISKINYPSRIFPIGRLDVNSSGLLLLTNHGEISDRILKAQNKHEKEYRITVNRELSENFLSALVRGVELEEGTTLPAKVSRIDRRSFSIVIVQGWNRQVRRMVEQFGYRVISLVRTRIMQIELGDLPVGRWAEIEPPKLEQMLRQLGL